MKSIRTKLWPAMTLGTAVLSVTIGLLTGCAGERPLAPERSWEEIRYHASQSVAGGEFRDVLVRASGELEWDTQEEGGASTRGLLAGENLETLTRLIDALPPAGFIGTAQCDESFFLTVLRDGERLTFEAGRCDPGLPLALQAIAEGLDSWIEETNPQKIDPVPFRILAQGTRGGRMAGHTVATSVDELSGILGELTDRPIVLPRVEFASECVVAVYLGERPSAGYSVNVTGVFRTDSGRLMLSEAVVEPGPGCVVAQSTTSPYVLVAVEDHPREDLLFRVETRQTECRP